MLLKSTLMACALVFSGGVSQASTIAIIDSGVDIDHERFTDRIWINEGESENRRDDDKNGYKDDIYGWNFFGNNNKVIDRKYDDLLNDDILQFFDLQAKVLTGSISEEELAWLQDMISDQDFVQALTKFGTYAHGTHVAGIAAGDNEQAEILTIRLIPVENPLAGILQDVIQARNEGKKPNFIIKQVIKGGLYLLAKTQGGAFGTIGSYLADQGADIANGSLGMSMMQARILVQPIVSLATGGDPDPRVVDELAKYFVERTVKEQSVLVNNAPNTLFVFAAGNDGTNNDELPVSPANIRAENAISVAATTGRRLLAPFSNFGKKVDVAAPGVSIESAIPNHQYMALSGTSQAAPYVAQAAAAIFDANPRLSPAEIKKIVLGTVDQKDFLQGKVKSGGIVNLPRAVWAAEASVGLSVDNAIAESMQVVEDIASEMSFFAAPKSLPFHLPGIM